MSEFKILVPSDFTPASDNALAHAATLAKRSHGKITVLHVVGDSNELEDARLKLEAYEKRAKDDFNTEITTLARIGSIFEDIPEVLAEYNMNMVVMGTHGLRGLQFILGSRALRIVTSSKVPFIIVQERGIRETGYDDIVVPLDLHSETKQKLSLVAQMATYFDSRAHLIIPTENDEFLKSQLSRNLKYAEEYFAERKINFTAKISEESSDHFVDGILEHAEEVEADLIAIMNVASGNVFTLPSNKFVQRIITNKKEIPAMVLNPRETYDINYFAAYEGSG